VGEALIEGPGMTRTKCVQVGDEEEISLEGKLVWVGGEDGDSGEMKRLKLLEVKQQDCQRGLWRASVIINQAAKVSNIFSLFF